MGKAARNNKNKKDKFYKNPKVNETELAASKELLVGLDSTNVQTRIGTSGAISAMFGDMQSDLSFSDDMTKQYKDNLEMVIKTGLLKKIISRATDNEYLVCMNILGAIRNMCIVGGDDFVKIICDLNVIIPLKKLLYARILSLQSTTEMELLVTCSIYLQLFSIFTMILYYLYSQINHSDVDASGFMEIETSDGCDLYNVIVILLSYKPQGSAKLQSLVSLMQSTVAEFVSVLGDRLSDNTAFLQEVINLSNNMSWPLKFKIMGIYINCVSSVSGRIQIIEDAIQVLHESSLPSVFDSLSSCYVRFGEIEQEISKEKMPEEMVLDDADASEKMDKVALDAGETDNQGDVVNRGDDLSRHIMDYLNVMDIIERILSQDDADGDTLLDIPSDVIIELTSTIASLLNQLDAVDISNNRQIGNICCKLTSGLFDLMAAVVPYMQVDDGFFTLWSILQKHLSSGNDVTLSVVKVMWSWSQIICQTKVYNDSFNPVCFHQQIGSVLGLLQTGNAEIVVQVVNITARLLGRVTECNTYMDCLRDVCSQVVHCLDNNNNCTNSEVLGCVLDFMMTIFGDDKYTPMFKMMNISNYVFNATNGLQTAISKDKNSLDEDCVEYLDEILHNAFRFIEWIQSGMK